MQVVDADRIEDGARLERDVEVAQTAEEVVVLPPGDEVDVRLDLVDLEATSECDLSKSGGLRLHGQRDDRVGRRRVGKSGDDLDRTEHAEVEQRLSR